MATRSVTQAFVIEWRSDLMPAPAFWYFRDESAATEMLRYFAEWGHYVAHMRTVDVPPHTPFMDQA